MAPNAIAGLRNNHGNLHDQTPSAPLISYPDQPPWFAFQVRPLVRKSAHFTDNPPVPPTLVRKPARFTDNLTSPVSLVRESTI